MIISQFPLNSRTIAQCIVGNILIWRKKYLRFIFSNMNIKALNGNVKNDNWKLDNDYSNELYSLFSSI